MARVFKRSYTDEKGRKRKTKRYYGHYVDHLGIRRRVPLATDKTASETMLAEKQRKADRRKAGHTDEFDAHAKRPLPEHVAVFETYLESKGGTASHAKQTATCVRAIIDGCGYRTISDINASKVSGWLKEQRDRDGDTGSDRQNEAAMDWSGWPNVPLPEAGSKANRRTGDDAI